MLKKIRLIKNCKTKYIEISYKKKEIKQVNQLNKYKMKSNKWNVIYYIIIIYNRLRSIKRLKSLEFT
jgi:hypothetical protein